MREMMIDLETLDVRPCALVLSIGAVVFDTNEVPMFSDGKDEPEPTLDYTIVERFLRKPNVLEQIMLDRTTNEHTIRWWRKQDPTAKAEAFDPVRQNVALCFEGLRALAAEHNITKFWANPVAFDLIILEELANAAGVEVPWNHRQRFDLRTVVNEASYSTKDHVPLKNLVGVAHTPVYDCEWQIDVLTAARRKIARRVS